MDEVPGAEVSFALVYAAESVRSAVGYMLDRINAGGGAGGYECECPCCSGTLALVIGPRKAAVGHSAPYCPGYQLALAELDAMREAN